MFKKYTVFTLLIFGLSLSVGCSKSGFNEKHVEAIKKEIRESYESKGFTVDSVNLIIESSNKLTGNVQYKNESIIGKTDQQIAQQWLYGAKVLTSECKAIMGQGEKYTWSCK